MSGFNSWFPFRFSVPVSTPDPVRGKVFSQVSSVHGISVQPSVQKVSKTISRQFPEILISPQKVTT